MWARQYNLRRALSAGSIERDIRMRRNVHSLKLALVLLIALAVPRASHAEVDEATPRAAMSTRETTELTRWLEANELNEFGDPKDTMYTGGTPLFDESTGESRDRYAYIAARHPDAPWKKDSQPKMVDVDEKIEASRFPERWGPEPVMQTRDYRELPGGYGTRPRAAHRARRAPSVSRRGGRSDPQGCDVNPGNDGVDEMAGS